LAALTAWCGPIDPPRARGSHRRLTPTSGGLAILAAACVGAAALAARLAPPERSGLAAVAVAVGFAALLGLIGAADDVLDLGARPKLLIQALFALVFTTGVARVGALPLGPGLNLPLGDFVGSLGAALWIVVATNAVNFMDGANGVAGGACTIAFAALGVGAARAGQPATAAAALAASAANLGYLPWNLSGRLFQGDAGALFSGFLLAALALTAERGGAGLYLYFTPLALLPFLTDVLLTLLVRARRGASLLDAHRDHLFQLWLQRTGKPHGALAWRVGAIMAAFSAAALGVQQAPAGWRPMLFAAALALSIGGWTVLRHRLQPPRP
jgi:UDP-GlcNAc:undecaprenyl-phosphate/decaprenyl-phosphate GlcNAc-1-phosphate transferase